MCTHVCIQHHGKPMRKIVQKNPHLPLVGKWNMEVWKWITKIYANIFEKILIIGTWAKVDLMRGSAWCRSFPEILKEIWGHLKALQKLMPHIYNHTLFNFRDFLASDTSTCFFHVMVKVEQQRWLRRWFSNAITSKKTKRRGTSNLIATTGWQVNRNQGAGWFTHPPLLISLFSGFLFSLWSIF